MQSLSAVQTLRRQARTYLYRPPTYYGSYSPVLPFMLEEFGRRSSVIQEQKMCGRLCWRGRGNEVMRRYLRMDKSAVEEGLAKVVARKETDGT
jgi:hypothetical protein